jgi:hypothetical protein
MGTSARTVARRLCAAAALVGVTLMPVASGVSQAGGMSAPSGGARSSGSLGVRRGSGLSARAGAALPGLQRRATAAGGIAVRTMPSYGEFRPPANFGVLPLAPGTIIFPVSPVSYYFPGGVISPLVPGTVVNPLLPGTIFTPLFPTTSFFPVFPGMVFAPVFPSAFFFPFAPSIVPALPPGIVPPLLPQFVVIRPQLPLVEFCEPEPEATSAGAGAAAQTRAPGAGVSVKTARTGALWAAPRRQASEAPALQQWVRTQNAEPRRAAPAWGLRGGATASTDSSARTEAGGDPSAIEAAFGRPAHRVTFLPRSVLFDDFFTTDNGRLGFTQFRHHPAVTADVYYPHYVNDPSWFAFRYPGQYPSVYALWGWTPPWIAGDRVSFLPPNGMGGVSYSDSPEGTGEVDVAGAARCLEGIRRAWLSGDPQRVAPYLSSRQEIRVYFNREYEYSVPAADFYAMTVDAIGATQTVAVEFDNPVWLSAGDVIVTGRNSFRDPNGNPKTVYVSYRVTRLGDGWYLTDFGSSLEPIPMDSGGFGS